MKVGDFNLSRMAETAATNSNMSANNPRWLAPEVITHQARVLQRDRLFISITA